MAGEEKLDAGRLTVRVTAVVGIITLAFVGGKSFTETSSMAEANQEGIDAILDQMSRMPTESSMEAAILRAVRPLDASMAKFEAQLSALRDQVKELKDTRNK